MESLTNCTVLCDEKHPIFYGSKNYITFFVVNGEKYKIKSNFGNINIFCTYNFEGQFDEKSVMKISGFDMSPKPPSKELFQKICQEMYKRDKSFETAKWSHFTTEWILNGSKDIFQMIDILSLKYSDIAFWSNPGLYSTVYNYYQTKDVFNWSLSVIKDLNENIELNPYRLTFTSPFQEMDGSSIDIAVLQEFLPENDQNKCMYDVCRTAERFCENPTQKLSKGTIPENILETLLSYGFVRVLGGWVVLKRTFDLYEKVKRITLFPVFSNSEVARWCQCHTNYKFITNNRMITEQCQDVDIQYEFTASDSICLYHIEQFTLSDFHRFFDIFDPEQITGVGLPNAIGNYSNYNIFHFLDYNIPIVPETNYKVGDFDEILKQGKKINNTIIIRAGNNIFHESVLIRMNDVIKQFTHKKATYTSNKDPYKVPWKFREKLQSADQRVFLPKQRVLIGNSLLFIKRLLFVEQNPGGKRKRPAICKTTTEYKKNKKISIELKDCTQIDFNSVRNKIAHYGLIDVNRALSLQEDVIVHFHDGTDITNLFIQSLEKSCKQLIIIVSENTSINKLNNWNMIDFGDINYE